jgi:2-amino-4-hydroxy-6-hydroxymethyldihydropteridine diphosphokinase
LFRGSLERVSQKDKSAPSDFCGIFSTQRVTLKVMQTAYIGMGGNLASSAGAPEVTLAAAVVRLKSLGRVVRRSSLYSTAPVGFATQPRFVNAVVDLETELEPRELLERLQAIEQEFGRDRSTGIVNGPDLVIPHPRMAERAFVLVPLNEIAAKAVVPGTTKTVGQLLTRLIEATKAVSGAVIRVRSERAWPIYRQK